MDAGKNLVQTMQAMQTMHFLLKQVLFPREHKKSHCKKVAKKLTNAEMQNQKKSGETCLCFFPSPIPASSGFTVAIAWDKKPSPNNKKIQKYCPPHFLSTAL